MSVAKLHTVKHARQAYAKAPKLDAEGQQVRVPVTRKRTGEQLIGRGGRPRTKRVTIHNREVPLPMPKCGRCGDTIEVGQPYRWFSVGFRSHSKSIRCMKGACYPKESTRESSGIRAGIMAAVEDFYETIDGLDSQDADLAGTVDSAVQAVGEAFREAADQWKEADEAFGDGSGGNTENYERGETAGSAADDLEQWSHSGQDEPDFEDCESTRHTPVAERDDEDDDEEELERGDSECDDCSTIRENWFSELTDEAREAVDGAEIP